MYKKKPAKEDPMILTKAVEIGIPLNEKLKSVNMYLKDEPIVAPKMSAKYELIIRESYFTNWIILVCAKSPKRLPFFIILV